MQIVGRVSQIWRFPVKSMGGESLNEARVEKTGVVGDRIWAMRHEQRAEIQWGKMFPQLMRCEARYRSAPMFGHITPVDIRFPDDKVLGSDDDKIHSKLSELVGRSATLRHVEPPSLLFDKTILRTIVQDADQNLGVYGVPIQAGEMKVGDVVELSG